MWNRQLFMSNVALIGSFVWVYFHLLRLFNLCLLNLFIYVVLGYHIRWWNKVVYKTSVNMEIMNCRTNFPSIRLMGISRSRHIPLKVKTEFKMSLGAPNWKSRRSRALSQRSRQTTKHHPYIHSDGDCMNPWIHESGLHVRIPRYGHLKDSIIRPLRLNRPLNVD